MTGYFDSLYAGSDDPWQVRSRWYERRKQALLLACLPRERFRHACEPACGTGALTAALAQRCDRVSASDCCGAAVAVARRSTAGLAQVEVERRDLPQDWPQAAGGFDLVVLGEFGYYLAADAWRDLLRRCAASLAGDAVVVACHWRHGFAQRLQSTEALHEAIDALPGLERLGRHAEHDFLIDIWSRGGGSVAAWEGLR
ncbi:class I SAM-dependent methyltransferase [Xylophilus sp.]|uniref:methyltransferase domain-containing protein n=1 Tax=Xylophilus sp. TaxID=2653893 RepID=UPI0013B7984A|nr:class I SAM-dependent methyltransferase [Xylophilus sp.]KAF1049869.1 MAG: hypothetical protein GAK38_00533 [Xylophilus sp.]